MDVRKTIAILIGMALCGTLGLLLLFLACALPFFSVWWPMFVVIFYLLSPLPLALIRFFKNREWMDEENHVGAEVAYFISACIVVSAFGLPLVMVHKEIIHYGAGLMVCAANTFMFATVYSYFVFFKPTDEWEFSSM